MTGEKSSTSKSTARLHVMLASEAPFAVILRRGPAKQVCTIGWNLDDDTFQVGQWLKGRIYEKICDLSPDGRHLLYHSSQYHLVNADIWEYTVLSRAPYLKALKIWKNKAAYGGAFIDNERFSLLGNAPQPKIFRVMPFGEVKNAPELAQIQRVTDVFQWRLQSGGWQKSEDSRIRGIHQWYKKLDEWELNLTIKDSYLHPTNITYSVNNSQYPEVFDCTGWQWADFRDKRLLWAQEGKIFAVNLGEDGHGPIQQLADFNDWTFEPIVAPY